MGLPLRPPRREVAAYELSEALGWGWCPPTVLRDGPLGEGSVQRFVDADFSEHYFTLLEDERHDDAFRRLCAFDLVANNTDRKGGHCLLDEDGRIWAIDNGLCFHDEFKVRTVIWDFAGEPLPERRRSPTCSAAGRRPARRARRPARRLRARRRADPGRRPARSPGRFPHDPTGHRYPWPLV